MKRHLIQLRDAFKADTGDQDKILPPEETLRRVRKKLAAVDMDILDHTARIDTGRLDIPVFFSHAGADARRVTGDKKQMGKGGTPAQAEASAVMELVERYSFYQYFAAPPGVRIATAPELGESALAFDQIAASVHDTDEPDAAKAVFDLLPQRWAPAHDLTSDREVLVPVDWFFAINEFNGACAGNCMEEALCQGMSEVVERHVCAVIDRERPLLPGIDPDSVTDAVARGMIRKYRRAGISLHLHDFSLDTGIATVGALAWDGTTFPGSSEIVWTAGASPDPEKAVSRALSEIAQLAGDFNTDARYMASGLSKPGSLEEAARLAECSRMVSVPDLPDLSDPNIRIEAERLITASADAGRRVFFVNTTHPGLDIPAGWVLMPGARFRERAVHSSVGMFAARLAVERHGPEAAARLLDKMDGILPNRYYLYFQRGVILLASHGAEAALPLFRQALELGPPEQDLPAVLSCAGRCLSETGAHEDALQLLEQGLAADPGRTDILNQMGVCHFRMERYEKAIEVFERLLELNPASAIDRANIAVNRMRLGQTEAAITGFQTALAMDPGIGFARDFLERLLLENRAETTDGAS